MLAAQTAHALFFVTLLLAPALISTHTISTTTNLEAILTNSKLPTGMDYIPAVYDSQDSIYVLGGQISHQIIKYSIAEDQVEVVGRMVDRHLGSAVWGGNGNIYYFGGRSSAFAVKSEIWGLNTNHPNNMTGLASLPETTYFATSFWDGGDKVYVIGGCRGWGSSFWNTIKRYSIASRQVNIEAARLPSNGCLATVVWNANARVAYVFGGFVPSGDSKDILEFNPDEGTVVKLNATLPHPLTYSCSVWTGAEAYIIGGSSGDDTTWSKIVRFNPSTNQVVKVEVRGFPDKLRACGCAFVEKLNRIYILGGWDGSSYSDEIMYIDLGPKVPASSCQKILNFNISILVIIGFNYFL